MSLRKLAINHNNNNNLCFKSLLQDAAKLYKSRKKPMSVDNRSLTKLCITWKYTLDNSGKNTLMEHFLLRCVSDLILCGI